MSNPKFHTIYPPLLLRARELRHPLTPAEQKVWTRVRDSRLGFKIRRQSPVDHFLPDFYCAEARLLIEIDGDIHPPPIHSPLPAGEGQGVRGNHEVT